MIILVVLQKNKKCCMTFSLTVGGNTSWQSELNVEKNAERQKIHVNVLLEWKFIWHLQSSKAALGIVLWNQDLRWSPLWKNMLVDFQFLWKNTFTTPSRLNSVLWPIWPSLTRNIHSNIAKLVLETSTGQNKSMHSFISSLRQPVPRSLSFFIFGHYATQLLHT